MRQGTEPAAPSLPPDTHEAQAERIALHCERHPGREFTAAELSAACDPGCVSKVLSAMDRDLGYGMKKGWRDETCASGTRARQVRTYRVLHRPRGTQCDLFCA